MKPLQVEDAIRSIRAFKTHTARIRRQRQDAGRPTMIKHHGKPGRVLVATVDVDRKRGSPDRW
jgi:hypothetical protein